MRLREAADGAEYLLHGRRGAENLGCGGRDFIGRRFAQAFVDGAANQLHRVIDIEGLGQILKRAPLKGRHRAFKIGVGGHDDDRRGRQLGAQGLHEIEA